VMPALNRCGRRDSQTEKVQRNLKSLRTQSVVWTTSTSVSARW
jgi:hypothetical protein